MSTITKEFTKEQLIEYLKTSTQNSSGMFEISEDTICNLMSMLTYAAPQLPQPAVPDYDALRLAFEAIERKSDNGFNLHKYGIGYADEATQLRWEQWVACRAAMLQGGNDSLTHEGKNHPEDKLGMVNHLGDANEKGNSPVIPDGWVLVPEEPTHEMLEAGDEQFGTYDVYRRMIAASPQQK